MMYIVSQNEHGMLERSWHVGEKLIFTTAAIQSVIEVQADGDELAHVVNNFGNLKYAGDKVVNRWFGDDAKFIAANL